MKYLFSLLFCWSCLAIPVTAAAEPIGVISVAVGAVQWWRDGETTRLERGDAVQEGDRVTTGAQARLVLSMNDGSRITLGGDSQMLFSQWRYRKQANDNSAQLELLEGAFRFITGLITDQSQPQLSVTTPDATIGIRGTDFWGGYLQAGVLDVVLLEGDHALQVNNNAGSVLIQHSGEGVSVRAGQQPDAAKRWSPEKIERAVATVRLPER